MNHEFAQTKNNINSVLSGFKKKKKNASDSHQQRLLGRGTFSHWSALTNQGTTQLTWWSHFTVSLVKKKIFSWNQTTCRTIQYLLCTLKTFWMILNFTTGMTALNYWSWDHMIQLFYPLNCLSLLSHVEYRLTSKLSQHKARTSICRCSGGKTGVLCFAQSACRLSLSKGAVSSSSLDKRRD